MTDVVQEPAPGPSSEAVAVAVTVAAAAVIGGMICAFSTSWAGWSSTGLRSSIGLREAAMCVGAMCETVPHGDELGSTARGLGQATFYATIAGCLALIGYAVAALYRRPRLTPMPVVLALLGLAFVIGTAFAAVAPGAFAPLVGMPRTVAVRWAAYVHGGSMIAGMLAVFLLRPLGARRA
jgi:hypothetical protein